jgi:transposase
VFSGNEGGAQSWAILGSLISTAKLNDVDPQTYLADVLERIVSERTKHHQLSQLLVWNWKAARERSERAAA